METTPYKTRAAALNASLEKPGWRDNAVIREAVEDSSARGNTMMVLGIAVPVDGHGGGQFYKDYLTNTPRGAPRLRSACEAVGALDRYNAREISPDDFIGKVVRVKLAVERSARFGSRIVITDYAKPEVRAVVNLNLREVAS